jgi:hypothetical protein
MKVKKIEYFIIDGETYVLNTLEDNSQIINKEIDKKTYKLYSKETIESRR